MPAEFPIAGDPVVWAGIVPDGSGTVTSDGADSTDVTWLVRTNRPDATTHEIAASTMLPQRGEVLRRYRPSPSGIIKNGQMPPYSAMDVLNANLSVASYSFHQSPSDPQEWRVGIHYEQTGDPTTLPSEFYSDSYEYQTSETIDAYGRPIDNSARELVIGGMPTDRNQKAFTIIRCLPYHAWHSRMGDDYQNTLNREEFALSRQFQMVNGFQTQVTFPPGACRLKKISENEIVRSPAPLPNNRKYYWRVRAEIHVDMRELKQPDGRVYPIRHRFAYADQGYRQLTSTGNQIPFYTSAAPSTEQVMLDNKGKVLTTGPVVGGKNTFSNRPDRPSGWVGVWPGVSDNPRVESSEWETTLDQPLNVEAPGVLLTAYDPSVLCTLADGPTHGTVDLKPDGSFLYTPTTNYSGFDWFSFTPFRGATAGAKVAVFVLTRPQFGPWWQLRSRYKTKSWSPLDALLVGW